MLASRVGGIPESLGPGGVLVDEIRNPDAWTRGLAQLEEGYDEYAERGRLHAEKFSKENAAERFREIVHAFPG